MPPQEATEKRKKGKIETTLEKEKEKATFQRKNFYQGMLTQPINSR